MLDSHIKSQTAQLKQLYSRIEQIRKNLLLDNSEGKAYFAELNNFITKEDLIKAFDYILDAYTQTVLASRLQFYKMDNEERISQELEPTNFAARFEQANWKSKFPPRTLNVLENHDGEFILLIEKEMSKHREMMEYDCDYYKILRIDPSRPVPWVSIVAYGKEISDKKNGAFLSQKLYKKALQMDLNPIPFTFTLIGNPTYSINKNNEIEDAQSFFTPYAKQGDLFGFIQNPKNKNLSRHAKHMMAMSLLKGLKILHDMGIAHQDIKPHNILVYPDGLKWIDFESAEFIGTKTPYWRSQWFTPPEKELPYLIQDLEGEEEEDEIPSPYARHLATWLMLKDEETLENYRMPLLASDMFSLGLVLYTLYTLDVNAIDTLPLLDQEKQLKPLLEGLLVPQPEKRLNIVEAIQLLEKIMIKEAQQSLMPPPTYLPQSNRRKVRVQSSGDAFRAKRAKGHLQL